MKIVNLTAEALKDELKRHNNKSGMSFDLAYIKQLEGDYNMRFIGAHVCKDKLNFQVYTKKEGSDNYTTATISMPEFRSSTTALRFANAVCDLVQERAELKDSERYLQMQNKVNELQDKETRNIANKIHALTEGPVKGAPEMYDADYYKKYSYQAKKEKEPSLEELTLTLNAVKSMPNFSTVRAQIGPVRNIVKQYISEYAA
jgi:hypothetical protein